MTVRNLEKYLRTHSLEKPWSIEGIERRCFRMALVIPVLAELQALPLTLASLARNPSELLDDTLIVIVVNQCHNTATQHKKNNRATLDWLAGKPLPNLHIGVVNATAEGLEFTPKDGVGLARKIGFDLSLELLDWDAAPLLISLDADTLVDHNYLSAIQHHFKVSSQGGAVIPFYHQKGVDGVQENAIRSYELYLRSYLFGLAQAGSPYAYHTIGSAFCCLAQAYVGAGGMNRRLAAEDFYFLQRLAKTTGIECLSGTVVAPAARFSDRVPFGTGPTLKQHVENDERVYQFIGVEGFEVLQGWLAIISQSMNDDAEDLLLQAERLSSQLVTFLNELNFSVTWGKLQNNYAKSTQRLAAFHVWFDALRTRQLLSRFGRDDQRDAAAIVSELLAWGGQSGKLSEAGQLAVLEKMQGVASRPSPRGGISDLKFKI